MIKMARYDSETSLPAWDAIDEASPRGAMARRDARLAAREGRGTVEVPPYVVNLPEWAARWGETAPPVGTILRWTLVDSTLSHVAICTEDDTWNTTDPGVRGGALNFASLARLIANSPCSVAVDWREIPTVAARPAGDDAVKDWASQFLAPSAPAADEPAAPAEGH